MAWKSIAFSVINLHWKSFTVSEAKELHPSPIHNLYSKPQTIAGLNGVCLLAPLDHSCSVLRRPVEMSSDFKGLCIGLRAKAGPCATKILFKPHSRVG